MPSPAGLPAIVKLRAPAPAVCAILKGARPYAEPAVRREPGQKALTKPLKEALERLRRGGVIVIPTDTLYGLAADVSCPTALERVFRIKGRPPGMALPVLVGSAEQVLQVPGT